MSRGRLLGLLCGFLAACAFAPAARAAPGALVIVGGGLSLDNAAIHRAFLERAGPNGRIAIVPAASGEPAQSAAAFVEALAAFGAARERIDIVRLAVRDDEASAGVDESAWAKGALEPAEIAKIEAAQAIWMTGGDQARLTQALYAEDGGETPMLKAMRRRLAAGAVIGGTSAGAAVMSAAMIARGDSLAAMIDPVQRDPAKAAQARGEALTLTRGLGFLPEGLLVDQHFDARARLGRLTRALAEAPRPARLAFGVDEDTALVVDLASGSARAIGAGSVTVLDASRASFAAPRGRFEARGVRLHVINSGDAIALASAVVTPVAGKALIAPGREAQDHIPVSGGGMAVADPGLERTLADDLLDNSAANAIERVSLRGDGAGVIFRFAQTPDSAGHFGRDAAGRGRYTLLNVEFSILPIHVSIRRLN